MAWKVHEAKERFGELVERAVHEGPQTVTQDDHDVVVVLAADEYRRLAKDEAKPPKDFKEFLLGPPYVDDLEIHRSAEPPRKIEL